MAALRFGLESSIRVVSGVGDISSSLGFCSIMILREGYPSGLSNHSGVSISIILDITYSGWHFVEY